MINIDKSNENYVVASFPSPLKKLDILVADKIKSLLQEIIEEGKPVIMDLENILYIDSSGFGAIISLFNYAKNRGLKFILYNVSKGNMELVKITKLTDVLIIKSDKEAAIKFVK